MTLKKAFAGLVSAIIVAGAQGCGDSNDDNRGPPHLLFSSYMPVQAWEGAFTRLVDSYVAANQEVSVELDLFPDASRYVEHLDQMIAEGRPPDVVMYMPDVMPQYMIQDRLLDLDPYMTKSGIDGSLFFTQAWDGLKFGPEKHAYGAPLTYDSMVLYYNKDLFDAAGRPYPDGTWTYDDLMAAAQALTVKVGGTTTQWGLGFGWEPWYFGLAMFGQTPWDQQNFQSSNFDKPELAEAIERIATFYKNGYSPVQAPDSGTNCNGSDLDFTEGNMAMLISGTWMTQAYLDPAGGITSFRWDNAPVPKANANSARMTVGQPNALFIMKSTRFPDEAFALLHAFALSSNGQETLAPLVEIPAMKSAAETTYQKDWLDQLDHPDVQLATMQHDTTSVQFGLLSQGTWFAEVDNQLDAVWKGAAAAEVCPLIAASLNSKLAAVRSAIQSTH